MREREIYRERRKWRHHCRAKIGDEFTRFLCQNSHNWRSVYTFPCQNSHFSFLPSYFPSLPSLRGHHCGAEIRNEFTLSVAKNFFTLFVPTLSNGASRATSDRKPKTNDQILPSPILFFPSKNWIKLIPKPKPKEKEIVREVARGDKPYLRKSTDRKAQIRKAFVQFSGLICSLAICRFSQGRFITPSMQESQGVIKLFSWKLTWNWRFAPPWEACSTGEVLCLWMRYDQPMMAAEMVGSHPVVVRGYHAGAREN